MTDGAQHSRIAELKLWADEARGRSTACTAQAVRAAESAAIARGETDRMIERLTERNPQLAGRLQVIRSTAVREREAIGARKYDFYAARQGSGQVPGERQDEHGAAALAALDIYLRDMAVVQERDRIAGELLDNVIRRVFAAGLTLQGAAGLTTSAEVRQRIQAAADDLDEVIQAIRDTVFNPT